MANDPDNVTTLRTAAQAAAGAVPDDVLAAAEREVSALAANAQGEPAKAPAAPVPTPIEPGLPSPFQSHSANWIDKTRLDNAQFALGHDRLTHELTSMEAAHAAAERQRQADFDAETNRIAAAHDLRRDELEGRIADMAEGLAATADAIKRYEDRMRPMTENIRDEQEGGQQ